MRENAWNRAVHHESLHKICAVFAEGKRFRKMQSYEQVLHQYLRMGYCGHINNRRNHIDKKSETLCGKIRISRYKEQSCIAAIV